MSLRQAMYKRLLAIHILKAVFDCILPVLVIRRLRNQELIYCKAIEEYDRHSATYEISSYPISHLQKFY
jgi:hypothetical protein